jgi:P27 family predicted phage terminase small subunit
VRGRKPKPSWLKIVSGNPGRRPMNDAEPEPTGDISSAPEWLTDSQREVWRTAVENAPPGLLRSIDESVFLVWVIAKDLHRDATEKVAKYGAVIKSPDKGTPMQSPFVSVLNRQAQIMLKAAAEMGFTPSSRSRVKVENRPSKSNKFAELKEIGDV